MRQRSHFERYVNLCLLALIPAAVIGWWWSGPTVRVVAAQGSCASAAFAAQAPMAAGGRPRPVAIADFNGDGRPDLAIGNSISLFGGFSNYNVTVMLNQGNGAFAAAPGSPRVVDDGPISMAAADFNGDGKPDLAVASEIAKTVTILLGDGTGAFTAAGAPISFSSRPTFLLAQDINGDTRIDLIVAKADDNNINILLGTGTGGFSEAVPSPISTGTRPFFIASGDFNNDSRPDFAIANLGSQNITILINIGSGRFSRPGGTPITVPGRAYGLAVADFNGDGRADIAVKTTPTGSSLGNLTVLLGNGGGTFSTAPSPGAVPQPAPVGFFGYIAASDFDRDGKIDVAVANSDGSDLSVWYGDGTGGFRARQRINTLFNPYAVAIADFDGNGFPDLAATFESQEKVAVFLGGCNPASNSTPTIAAAAAVSRQQGSSGTVGAIATVSDADSAAGTLTVTADNLPDGLSVTNIVNNNGAVSATIGAYCDSVIGANTVILTVSDAKGFVSTAPFTVNVTANAQPSLGSYAGASVPVGNGIAVTPTGPPTDNGSVIAVTATAPANFTGTLSADAATGVVTVGSAAPIGSYPVTVTAYDNCGATTTRTFTLTVTSQPNNPPTIAVAAPLQRQQGSPGIATVIATVNDTETPAASLGVAATSVPAGITIANLVNTNGSISATVTAGCNAALGANTVQLTVTDGGGSTAVASLTVNVTPNAPPSLGSYTGASISVGAGAQATPTSAPSDSGGIASLTASASPGFGGTVGIDAGTGVVTIANARPAGSYTITISAVDNCGAGATASFALTVNKLASSVALTASAGPYITGQPLTLTASVGGTGPTPTGVVAFLDGVNSLGTGTLDANGIATLATAALGPGAHSLTAVYNGDANFNGGASAVLPLTLTRAAAIVSAANYQGAAVAPEQIVAAFGTNLATATLVAPSQPLPTTLAGTTIRVRDSAGAERLAPLFFVSPTQINFLVPEGTALGNATASIQSGDGAQSLAVIRVDPVMPGLFSADATGAGYAAAVLLRLKSDGTQLFESVARFDTTQNKFVPVPIDFGAASDSLFVVLYGTGIRNRSSLTAVNLKIGGTDIEVLYAGSQGLLTGLDQVNGRLPRSLAGRGDVDVVLTVDGKTSNTVRLNFK